METLRQKKKREQEALWRALTPAERLQRASELTEFALELRDAGRAYLASTPAKRAKTRKPR